MCYHLISPFPSYSESSQLIGLFLGELNSLKSLFIMKDIMAVYCPNDPYEVSATKTGGIPVSEYSVSVYSKLIVLVPDN